LELWHYVPDDQVLSRKGLVWVICQLTRTKKTIGEESLDIAQGMNRPAKMAAMGYEWI
jgi:ribosomal protein L36